MQPFDFIEIMHFNEIKKHKIINNSLENEIKQTIKEYYIDYWFGEFCELWKLSLFYMILRMFLS